MNGAYSLNNREEKYIQNLSLKSEVKRPLGNPICREEDNITMELLKR